MMAPLIRRALPCFTERNWRWHFEFFSLLSPQAPLAHTAAPGPIPHPCRQQHLKQHANKLGLQRCGTADMAVPEM